MKKIKHKKTTKTLGNDIQYLHKETTADQALALYSNGFKLHRHGRIDEAILFYQRCLQINPEFAPAFYNLGTAFHAKNQLDYAVTFYEKALHLDPNLIEAHYNLGTIFQERKQLDKAFQHYQKATEINPDLTDPHYNMGLVLQEQGRQKEALSSFDQALRCDPSSVTARWAKCMAQIPLIYGDPSSIQSSRGRYRSELLNLSSAIRLETPEEIDAAVAAVGKQQPFYLAYQGLNDRELQQIYGDLVCRIMAAKYPQFSQQLPMPRLQRDEPIRIGIVSGFFHYHAVWKIPIRGWLENLDRNRLSLYGYCTGIKKDSDTEIARKYCTRFVENVFSFEELCGIIRADNLHLLIYPEIGMDPTTLKLAALRFAPVQCASWGHADTSGLPTIDYYLSSDLMEPADADQHYTEQLVRLPNLSIYYIPPQIKAADVSRDSFGLRPNSVLYHCCQSLYKHSPRYDDLFPRIAQQVHDCQFLFASYPNISSLIEQFRVRLTKTFERFHLNAEDYVVFLPPLPPDWYQALNLLSDVYLDTIGWSGCNSVLEALSVDLPVVTCPTGFMRGREGLAIHMMMGLSETVASTPDEYVDLAVRIGNDVAWRTRIVQKIRITKHLVYRDMSCIRGLEDFIVGVVNERLQ